MREQSKLGWVGVVGVVVLGWAPAVHAHISLEQGGTHKSRYGDGALKDGPCGLINGTRGTNVYTYAPGETITITLTEYVPHPSYFRIAFDDDGDDGFSDPISILPIDPSRGCPYALGVTNDHCDASDFYNTAAVLAGMDNLDPHVSAAYGAKYTWQVTLPDVECANCTLQVIQVMQDPFGHGPYDNMGDVYHQCIDLVLTRSADAGVGMPSVDAGEAGADASWPGAGMNALPGEMDAGASAAGAGENAGGAAGAPFGSSDPMLGGAGMTGTLAEGITAAPGEKPSATCSAAGPGSQTPALVLFLFALAALASARKRRHGHTP